MEDSGHDQAQRLSLIMPQSCEQASLCWRGRRALGREAWMANKTNPEFVVVIIFAFNVLRDDCLDHCFHRSVTITGSEIQNVVICVQYTVYNIGEYRS